MLTRFYNYLLNPWIILVIKHTPSAACCPSSPSCSFCNRCTPPRDSAKGSTLLISSHNTTPQAPLRSSPLLHTCRRTTSAHSIITATLRQRAINTRRSRANNPHLAGNTPTIVFSVASSDRPLIAVLAWRGLSLSIRGT